MLINCLPLFPTDVCVRGVFDYMKNEKSGPVDIVRGVFFSMYKIQIKVGPIKKRAWTDFSRYNLQRK